MRHKIRHPKGQRENITYGHQQLGAVSSSSIDGLPPYSSSTFKTDICWKSKHPTHRDFTAATGKAHYRLFFKLGIQRSSAISFCFSHSSADALLFLHAKERALCFDAPNGTFEFYMSSVGDLKIVPIKKESLNQPLCSGKLVIRSVLAWSSSGQT